MWINATTFNHTIGVHIAQQVQEGYAQSAGDSGEAGMVAFGGYHEVVQGIIMLGCLLHVFWHWH